MLCSTLFSSLRFSSLHFSLEYSNSTNQYVRTSTQSTHNSIQTYKLKIMVVCHLNHLLPHVPSTDWQSIHVFLHAILWYAGMLGVLLRVIRRRRAGGRYYWMTTNISMTTIPQNLCCLFNVRILIQFKISTMTIECIASILGCWLCLMIFLFRMEIFL